MALFQFTPLYGLNHLYPYIIAAEEENRSDFVKQIESIDKAKENNLLELKKLYEEEEECGNQLRQMREE